MSFCLTHRFHPLLLLFTAATVFAGTDESSAVLWQSDLGVRDMAVLNDNRLLVATKDHVLIVNGDYQVRQASLPRLDRVFPGPDGITLSAGIAWEKDAAAHLYTGESEDPIDPVIFPMKPVGEVYRAKDGALWLVNPTGKIIRHQNGKTEQWEAGSFTEDGRVYGNNAFRFEFAESPEGQVVLYQQSGKMTYGADLNGFLIWDRRELRHVRVEGKYIVAPGCAEFLSEKTLLLGSGMGLRVYDVHSGETLEKWSPPENFFSEPVRPFFTRLLPDGTRLVFYCRGEGGRGKSGPVEHGGYTQIVEIKDGQWTKIPLKLDFTQGDFLKSPRPVLVGPEGEVWTPNRGYGLAHRTPDGTWRSYDVLSGVPFEDITSLVLDASRLWVADAKQGLAALDTRRLQAFRPGESSWSKIRLAAKPLWDREGRTFLLSSENGGEIRILSTSGEKEVLSLSSTDYDSSHTHYMAVDTEGDPWLFGNGQQRYAIVFHKGGVWRSFPRDIKRESQFPPNAERAFQSMLGKDPAFRIGTPDDPHYPVFSEDGRIVFINREGKVRYFDGLEWLTPTWDPVSGPKRASGPLFFHNGSLVAIWEEVSYQLDEATWTNRNDSKQAAPWIKLEEDLRSFQPASLSPPRNVTSSKRAERPPGCPIEASDITWSQHDGTWHWVGNANRIAGSPGGAWLTLDIAGTPLSMAKAIENVIHTPDNRIFFKHQESGHVYSIYTPSAALEVTLGNSNPDTLHSRNEVLNLEPTMNREPAEVLQRYRIGQGPWSGLLPVGPIQPGSLAPKGKHTLTLQYFGKDDLAMSRTHQIHFSTTHDLQQEIQTCLEMLGSLDFQQRNEASRLLEEIGEPALEDLIPHMDSSDPEISFRAREVVLKIRKQLKAKD